MPVFDSSLPLVSCIMPTYNRRQFVSRAIEYFLRQDYPNRELIIVDDGSDPISDLLPQMDCIRYVKLDRRATLGSKRNLACQNAMGELIMHWDDDDWHSPNRVSVQVKELIEQESDVCGLRQMLFYDPRSNEVWIYEYPVHERRWMIGGSLLFRKSFWEHSPFPNIQVGEDTHFLWSQPLEKASILEDLSIYVALIHAGNTSSKNTHAPYWRHWDGNLADVMGDDWELFQGNGSSSKPSIPNGSNHKAEKRIPGPEQKKLLTQKDETLEKRSITHANIHQFNLAANKPRVSCILATGNRPAFTRQAIRCFLRQSVEDAELIIVDDGDELVDSLCSGLFRVKHLPVPPSTPLGTKLNLGIQQAQGSIIQKLDDDDYYHPQFLEHALRSLDSKNKIVAWDCFLVLLKNSPYLRFSGHGWAAGGTLCFHKSLWEKAPFRALPREVDTWFLRDHHGTLSRVCAPEFYILLRHGQNTWIQTNQVNVDAFLTSKPAYPRNLQELVEPLDVNFYAGIMQAKPFEIMEREVI